MACAFDFTLNGQAVRVENVPPNTTLLEYLRASGRTGTKEGCAEGDCGACSAVVIEGDSRGRPAFRSFNSCLVPVALLAGRTVITVEGVATPTHLHPVQEKMVQCHGSQCGYCTPGFILSLFEGYYRDDLRTGGQLDEQLCGNLCRCTGYRPIREAAAAAFQDRKPDAFSELLTRAETTLPALDYAVDGESVLRPISLPSLFELIGKHPEARLVAGATELGLDITKRFRKFATLISLEAIPELRAIEISESEWRVGGAATLTQVEEKLAREFPVLRDMLRVFGSRQIRNRATLGGNLATASPIGDSALVLLALDARIVLARAAGRRVLPIDDFFTGYRQTALQAGEIIEAILVPRGSVPMKQRWFKVSRRREMDISTVAACFSVEIDSAGNVRKARLAFGGVAAMSVRARKTEEALLGKPWSGQTIADVLPVLASEFSPITDVRGSAAYRRGLITSLFNEFFLSENEEPAPLPLVPPLVAHHPPHESARRHVTGDAIYVDDLAARKGMLEVWPVCSLHARAVILKRDASMARTMPGIAAVLMAEDVPGSNDVGAVRHDEILLADREVFYHGQVVALVVGESQEACRAAAAQVMVEYQSLPPILKIQDAIAQDSFHNEPNFIRRGDATTALSSASQIIEGEFFLGGQEHFYLEMQSACAEPGEDGSMLVTSSTQHPSEVQHIVAHLLDISCHQVVVQCPRMGGGFGGKETQAATFAAWAALGAAKIGRPVRVRINRDLDMMLTGKRHPFLARFKVGCNELGELAAARIELFSDGGWSLDLSQPVTDRAVFHLDNCYYIPHVEFSGRVTKTNVASNTAFRGFGGPQGMLVIEEILDRIARRLNLPPEIVRERNLYRGQGETNTTHYGQEIGDNRIQRVWQELKADSQFVRRRAEIGKWNSQQARRKRGLAITPVKFGISFTLTHLNQAGALVLIYQDGTVQVNHGGTEMGQGVHTNIAAIAARELGLSAEKIRVMPTSTDKVPNTSATAASCGTDLNGAAVRQACEILRARLEPVAARILSERAGREVRVESLRFAGDFVLAGNEAGEGVSFSDVVTQAYFQRISLSSTGYYRTPEIHYDRAAGRGKPFHYFAVGAAVTEVEVEGTTGMIEVRRVDILHDAGDSINEGINRGQVEGGFVQGVGWLTTEELVWDAQGRLLTHSPDTYKIPAIGDRPLEFNVAFLKNATQPGNIYGSKAVGEPPLMLAISAREAIRDAVTAFGPGRGRVELASPATAEAIFMAIRQVAGELI